MGSSADKSIYFDAYKSIKNMFELMQLYKSFNNISFKAFLISTKSIPEFMDIIKKSHILNYLDDKDKSSLKYQEDSLSKKLLSYSLEKNIKIYCDYNEIKRIIEEGDEEENEFIIVDELFCRVMGIKDYFFEHNKINISINKSIMEITIDDYPDETFKFTPKGEENGIYKFFKVSNE